MGEVKRATRVAERVREEMAWLITREVRDPRVAGVIVSRVEMTDDLKMARVYVRLLEGGDAEPALEGLKRTSSMLRREVTKKVGLRYAPELRFFYDDGLDKTTRIEELLEEVKRDAKGASGEKPARPAKKTAKPKGDA
jgi:ribosome-binding factor A